jgi:IS5 family transposase
MSQLTFAEAEYAQKKRKTRREVFLEKLEQLLPWKALESTIAAHYASGRAGRPSPIPAVEHAAGSCDAGDLQPE